MTDCSGGGMETKEQMTWKYRQENRKSWDSLLLLEEWKGKLADSRARCKRCRKPGMPAWSCTQWPSCYQQHGTFQFWEWSASPSLDKFVFLLACQGKQWYVNCCDLNVVFQAGCEVFCWWLVCVVTSPDSRSFGHAINIFFSFTTRNCDLGTQFWEQCWSFF